MINTVIFDKGIVVGIVKIPKPDEKELVCLYENIRYNNDTINILYFQDLHYGITITDKMIDYIKQNK